MKKPLSPKFKDIRITNRKFLNKKEGLAAIETYVTTEFDSLSASIDISDCNRKVSLDFYTYDSSPKAVKVRLDKLNIIIEALLDFRKNFILATKELEKRKPVYEAYRKEKRAWQKANDLTPTILEDLGLEK